MKKKGERFIIELKSFDSTDKHLLYVSIVRISLLLSLNYNYKCIDS